MTRDDFLARLQSIDTAGRRLVFGFKQSNGKTTSLTQRYVLTDTSVKLKQLHEQQQAAGPTDKDNGH